MFQPTLVVLAAGIGRRYGGMKQIDPIGPRGEIILDYSVFDALQAGFGRVVLVISKAMEAPFRERIGRTIEEQVDTAYAYQRPDDLPPGFVAPPDREKPWGTAHATWACRHLVDTPFAVINADDFYGRSAFQMLYAFLKDLPPGAATDYCMVAYRLENTLTEHGSVSRGVCTLGPDGYLVEIQERTRIERRGEGTAYTEDGVHWIALPADSPVSMNCWGFSPQLFEQIKAAFPRFLRANQADLLRAEFYLPELVGELVREGRATVKALPADARWFGVTYHQDKVWVQAVLRDLVRRGVYPETLWSG